MRKLAPFLLLFAARSAAADRCTPSRVLVLLDKSSSMTADIGGMTKWDAAQEALDRIATTYNDSIEIGLSIFPDPNQCSPGHTVVAPSLGTHDAIMAALGTPPPESGNWTPMAQSIEAAGGDASMADATRRRFVLLITDGWQWCYPYDASTRFAPAFAVAGLAQAGIQTYVVGFGGEVDPLTLGRAAMAGGTALAGCDPNQSDPAAQNLCYYQAESPASLLAALMSIARQISAEICDGLDNNCDGRVDEDNPDLCPPGQMCQSGGCVATPQPVPTPLPPGGDSSPTPPQGQPMPQPPPRATDVSGCGCHVGGTIEMSWFGILLTAFGAAAAGRRGTRNARRCRR